VAGSVAGAVVCAAARTSDAGRGSGGPAGRLARRPRSALSPAAGDSAARSATGAVATAAGRSSRTSARTSVRGAAAATSLRAAVAA
jgi:hypothetical protein